MAKIKTILCVLCASLCFMSAFITFNDQHVYLVGLLFRNNGVRDEFVNVSLRVATETYRHGDHQFAKDVIQFYETLPYDGYFANYQEQAKNHIVGSTSRYLYLSNKSNDNLENLTFSKAIDWEQFGTKGNLAYFTDDLNDSNADAYIKPFNKFSDGVTTRYGKNKIIVTNIYNFDISKDASKNHIVIMNFIVPVSKVESFATELKETFIYPNFDCSQPQSVPNYDSAYVESKVCGQMYSQRSKLIDHDLESGMYFNPWHDPLAFPKPLLFLALIALMAVLVQQGVKDKKEIAMRNLLGNHRLKIFQRLFVTRTLSCLLSFGLTMGILSVLFLDFSHGSTAQFLGVLVSITVHSALGLILVLSVVYAIMTLNQGASVLKKTWNATFVVGIAILTKSVAIVILSILIIPVNAKKFGLDDRLKFIEARPHLKEGYTTEINYGFKRSSAEQHEADLWLFNTVEKYGFDFFNISQIFEYYDPFTVQNTQLFYLIVNRNELRHEAIYDSNNQQVAINQLKRNTLLISQEGRSDYEKFGFEEDVDVIYVQETGKYNAIISYGPPLINPAILVVVDKPDRYLSGINDYSIRTHGSSAVLANFYDDVTQKIGQTVLISAGQLYQETQEEALRSIIDFGLLYSTSVCMLTILTALLLVVYFETNRQSLAIAYMHGLRTHRRYRFAIATTYLLTLFLATNLLIGNHLSTSSSYDFNQSSGFWLFLACVGCINTGMLLHSIKHFERHAVVAILKGDA